jgi:DNA-binding NtrC family response regulator
LGVVYPENQADDSAWKAHERPSAAESEKAFERLAAWRDEQLNKFGFAQFPATSPAMKRVVEQIRVAADSTLPLTITGEAGTGKSTVARLIHRLTGDRRGTLRWLDAADPADEIREKINVWLPSPELDQSGRPAAWEGAVSSSGDRFQGFLGTIVVRSPERLEADVVVRLTSMLDSRPRRYRLILLTRPNEMNQVEPSGIVVDSIRYDFRVRSTAVVVELPPLRRRIEDLELWLTLFSLERRTEPPAKVGVTPSPTGLQFAPDALETLKSYDWPGNLHELVDLIEALSANRVGGTIRRADLSAHLVEASNQASTRRPTRLRDISLDKVLEEVERRIIKSALEACHRNKAKTANSLGLSRAKLLRRLSHLGLDGGTDADGESGST